ncbi:MAG: hypothetical protein COB15_16860 [Flavobacteriales bacterium]|nr:MAG: hypothetical protein COB15_16860 [Flavobacteriales bacterium]
MFYTPSLKILHKNSFGNIAKCKCCNDLQVTLGNIIFSLTEEEFLDLDIFFDEIRRDFDLITNNETRTREYIIKFNFKDLVLAFSHKELQDTIELINYSSILLEVNKTIDIF